MSESCPGCLASGKGQDEALSIATEQAKSYAKEIKKPVAVCKEGFEYRHYEFDFALSQGYQIKQVVSFHT
jgi:hypothetical protein